jgi:hypothetical protein
MSDTFDHMDCKSACNITKDGPLNTTYNQIGAVKHVQGAAVELWVDASDFTYTKSHSVSCSSPPEPGVHSQSFAYLLNPVGCISDPDAASVLDLHGTGYQFDIVKTKCGAQAGGNDVGSCKFSTDHQRLDMTGGGYCGGYITDPIVLIPTPPPPTPPPTPAPKYACDYKTLKCKKDPHGGSSSMADCSKTCCDAPLNCGMYNNTEICGHKYTICDVCDTCCHEWLKPQNICDACVVDECTSGRNPDCCVSFECVNSKCQRAFRATGKYPSIDACKAACG